MSYSSTPPAPPHPHPSPPQSSIDVDPQGPLAEEGGGEQQQSSASRSRSRSPPPSPSPPSPPARRRHDSSPSLEPPLSADEVEEEEKEPSHQPAASMISSISSPLPPPPSYPVPTYTLTPLRSKGAFAGVVPSAHDRTLQSPPPSFQDEAGNTCPVEHAPPPPAHRTRARRQNSVFSPGDLPVSSDPPVQPPPPPLSVAGVRPSQLRLFHVWQGRSKFWCDGHLMSGPDWSTAVITFFLVLVPALLFLVFPAADLITRLSVSVVIIGAVLTVLALVFLVITSTQDPGVIPRNSRPSRGDDEELPMTQEVLLDGRRVHVKYCATCRIYRPPRAVHCSLCDACVEGFDHHCPWLGTCIGRGNYRWFSLFLYTLTVLLLWVLCFSIVDMVDITREKQREGSLSLSDAFAAMLHRNPIAFLIAIYCWVASFFVVGLAGFHVFLVSTNQTTNEQLKAAFPHGSPWSRGCAGNWIDMCRGKRTVEGWKRRHKLQRNEEHGMVELAVQGGDGHPMTVDTDPHPVTKPLEEHKSSSPPPVLTPTHPLPSVVLTHSVQPVVLHHLLTITDGIHGAEEEKR